MICPVFKAAFNNVTAIYSDMSSCRTAGELLVNLPEQTCHDSPKELSKNHTNTIHGVLKVNMCEKFPSDQESDKEPLRVCWFGRLECRTKKKKNQAAKSVCLSSQIKMRVCTQTHRGPGRNETEPVWRPRNLLDKLGTQTFLKRAELNIWSETGR